ncbi:unnamed protein product [Calicophoron daubneyi]|uniref:SH3 domain-binding glutamic acid-rich-like protein n=1 Tax=Calicophoron daubneyi TaxID=300641 RepID=A0AAV2SZL7_CALDB
MSLRVYISSTSGNPNVKSRQQHVLNLLSAVKAPFETRDISASEEDKKYMQSALQKAGKKVVAPQIFSGDDYIGGYEELMDANECGDLAKFLRVEISRTPVSFEPT